MRITARLYDARERVRASFGTLFPRLMTEVAPMIRGCAQRDGVGQLEATMRIAATLPDASALMIIAGYVEMVEPTGAESPVLHARLVAEGIPRQFAQKRASTTGGAA